MRCVPLLPEHVPGLYEIYLRATASVAHCRFVRSMAHFRQALRRPAREGSRHLVADHNGITLGFAALLENVPAEDGVGETQLTALFAKAEPVAELLLNEFLGRHKEHSGSRPFPLSMAAVLSIPTTEDGTVSLIG